MAEVENRYAAALFALARENSSVDKYMQETSVILEVIRNEPVFIDVYSSPRLKWPEKEAFLKKALPGISQDIMGLFYILINKKRAENLIAVLERFLELVLAHKGVTTAKVYSALQLSSAQTAALQAVLIKKVKKQVRLDTYIDPSIIGGLLIEVDGVVLDSTIKRNLQELKKRMA